MIKKYHEFIVERFSLKDDFGITYDDLREILKYTLNIEVYIMSFINVYLIFE